MKAKRNLRYDFVLKNISPSKIEKTYDITIKSNITNIRIF